MTFQRWSIVGAWLFAMLSLLVPAAACAAGMTEGWTRVVTGGFTDPNNSYVPASIEFRGYLYLSTVANETGVIYSGSRKVGGDIWRSQDAVAWEQVGTAGLGNPHNSSFNFVVFGDRLYALANNLNDHGIEIWASEDGEQFTQIEGGGFGDPRNNWVQGFVLSDRLILAVSGAESGPQIWVSDDGATFRQVESSGLEDQGNTGILATAKPPALDGEFYVGTSNPSGGGEIWRSVDGLQWERVADNGLERSANTSLDPMLVFKDQLYAIGVAVGGLEALEGLEVYRSSDGTHWQKVVTDGFNQGRERNVTGSLAVFKDRLYLVANTIDPRVLIPGRPTERLPPRGFQIWVSDDGETWTQVGEDGFGASTTLYGTMTVIGTTAYLSAFDYHRGSQLWTSSDGESWEMVYREPDPSFFSMGGGVLTFAGHLIWIDNDLAGGVEIWRMDAAGPP